MPLLFLNERSCGTDCDPGRADRAMTEFARTALAVARVDRRGTALVSEVPLMAVDITHGYPVQKWAGQPRNHDYSLRLKQMQSKSPIRTVFPEGKDALDIEYRHQGSVVLGIGGAHIMDGLAASLPTEPCWDMPVLRVEREQLVESGDGAAEEQGSEIQISEVQVRHISSRQHVETHAPWIREEAERVQASGLAAVHTGAQLWTARAELFPHLDFLPEVEDNLRQLQQVWVGPVRRRLADLNEAVAAWVPARAPEGPEWRSRVTGEHEQRSRLCWFTDLDGERQLFDLHCRFTPDEGRVHFRFVPERAKVHVAYIGRKLGI